MAKVIQPKIITKESLNQMVRNPDRVYVEKVIGRALVRIHQRQTPQEQNINCTVEANNEGFSACDAYYGSKDAKTFMEYGHLSTNSYYYWLKKNKKGTPRIVKYHRQLNEVALHLRGSNV